MLTSGKTLFVLLMLFSSVFQSPAAGTGVTLLSPVEGDYLQGLVTITGEVDVDGFLSYETAFAYEDGRETSVWFLIKRDINQVQKGTLALWDTTTITDGDYQLRVAVQLEDGTQSETVVRRLHVSNYSPIPGGAAAEPTLQAEPRVGGAAPVEAPPAALPRNPAELTHEELTAGFFAGLTGGAVFITVLGAYLGFRRLRKK